MTDIEMTNEEARHTLKSLKEYYNDKNEDSYVGFDDEDNEALDMAIKALEQQLKTGRWIVIREEYEFMGGTVNEPRGCKCSNCNRVVRFISDFCPNCGAKMAESE